ncbi:uncharacterized protein CC84DRAFT_376800 [Paraphaeosphaeria sporulosa]|uniref:Uncharacterized protein n=1 Tax=Paraphaeosphaeria sporulosa TaxID=1460663 RepID=A0A177BW24_9PLEO|nr:uncharacterized protein CC84DRAFT_376800 [Paraphaeosphaeria sporulosa]OAF99693.1 hypothetical protein CC84DRAFT_376800 [Paraphaeosphaeria sporulosa]
MRPPRQQRGHERRPAALCRCPCYVLVLALGLCYSTWHGQRAKQHTDTAVLRVRSSTLPPCCSGEPLFAPPAGPAVSDVVLPRSSAAQDAPTCPLYSAHAQLGENLRRSFQKASPSRNLPSPRRCCPAHRGRPEVPPGCRCARRPRFDCTRPGVDPSRTRQSTGLEPELVNSRHGGTHPSRRDRLVTFKAHSSVHRICEHLCTPAEAGGSSHDAVSKEEARARPW